MSLDKYLEVEEVGIKCANNYSEPKVLKPKAACSQGQTQELCNDGMCSQSPSKRNC
jgi:hypothetical protein